MQDVMQYVCSSNKQELPGKQIYIKKRMGRFIDQSNALKIPGLTSF
jgi:hypothetical protein